ncbi:MAG TPA: DUF1345 domain-containing protein [Aeromicrobium sp.]|nr:DUF1345 domain-containing protein [Aeromicrobium sp.]
MHRSRLRLVAMCAVGAIAAILTVIFTAWTYAPVVGWAAASLTYITWVWLVIWRLDAQQTALHAVREDPSRAISDVLVLIASLGSLGAVAIILVEASSAPAARGGVLAGLAVASVALSWLLVHTLFTLRYASLYYGDEVGGVDFNQQEPPQYSDFAYLAFTIGMTFQVSDSNVGRHTIRSTALRHALLSYVFGTVILATTINLVVGLST